MCKSLSGIQQQVTEIIFPLHASWRWNILFASPILWICYKKNMKIPTHAWFVSHKLSFNLVMSVHPRPSSSPQATSMFQISISISSAHICWHFKPLSLWTFCSPQYLLIKEKHNCRNSLWGEFQFYPMYTFGVCLLLCNSGISVQMFNWLTC